MSSIKGIVSNHLNFIHMPTGRYVFALKALRDEAEKRSLDTLKAAADEAISVGERALRLEFAYEQARTQSSSARGEALAIDNQIDAQVGAIKAMTDARTVGPDEDPVVQAARRVLDVLFPRGIAPIVHQSFEVQLGILDVFLEHTDSQLASDMTLLGLEREVTRLRELVARFRAELNREADAGVPFIDVRAAREELHEAAALVYLQALASYPSLDEQATRQRESLIAGFTEQHERVRADHRRRLKPTDIDPVSGEELLEGDAPPSDVQPPVVSDDVVQPTHV